MVVRGKAEVKVFMWGWSLHGLYLWLVTKEGEPRFSDELAKM
jgi:hypothetical protein